LAGAAVWPGTAWAADGPTLQVVDVVLAADGTVRTMAQSSAVRQQDGTVVTSSAALDPAEAADRLPLRVQTEYWLEAADGSSRSGTDLSQIRGAAGRVTLQYSLQNLTVRPQDVSWVNPATGEARHRVGLVGVPLTVVGSATVTGQAGATLVTTAERAGQAVTDGVVSVAGGARQVQWATMLAPPMLPSSVVLTLVLDTPRFVPPTLRLTVQPGLVADPSLTALLTNTLGGQGPIGSLESSVLALLAQVNQQLNDVGETAEKVHQTVARDAQSLASEAFASLESSSAAMLAQIDATQQSIVSLRDQASSRIQYSNSQFGAGMTEVLDQIAAALGHSGGQTLLTEGEIDGCALGLPELADGQERTLAATVQLIDAQVTAVVRAFDQPDGDPDSGLGVCRQRLLDLLGEAIGTPGQTCADDPNTPEVEPVTVQCAITNARQRVWDEITALQGLNNQVVALLGHTGASALGARVLDLVAGVESLRQGLESSRTDLDAGLDAVRAALPLARARLSAMTVALDDVNRTGTDNDPLDAINAAAARVTAAQASYNAILSQINSRAALAAPSPAAPALTPVAPAEAVIGLGLTPDGFGHLPVVPGGLVEQVANLVANTLSACGGPGGDFSPPQFRDAAAVAVALDDLSRQPGCAAQSLAASLAPVVTAYNTTSATAATAVAAYNDAVAAYQTDQRLLNDIADLSRTATNPALAAANLDLTAAASAVTAATTAIRGQVDQVRVAIATIATGLDSIETATINGQVKDARQAVDDLLTTVWPGLRGWPNPVQPGSVICPADWSAPLPALPTPAVDAIVELSDRLACLNGTVATTLSGWFADAQDSLTAADDGLGLAADQADQTGLQQAQAGIGAAADALSAALTGQVSDAVRDDLALVDSSQEAARDTVARVLNELTATAQESVADLTAQVQQSTSDSEAARKQLQADFSRVMANLGDPDPTSRIGLVGKLHDAADQIGLAANQVLDVTADVTVYADGLRLDLSGLDLYDAQVKAADQRLREWHPFADQAGTTVFTYLVQGS
jgi:hypothetical protein